MARRALVIARDHRRRRLPAVTGAARVGASYRFPGALRGTTMGLTYLYRAPYLRIVTAATPTAVTDDLWIPGQSEWSGYVAYTHAPFANRRKFAVTYKVNVQNIFDDRSVTVAGYYPVGREVAFTTSLKF